MLFLKIYLYVLSETFVNFVLKRSQNTKDTKPSQSLKSRFVDTRLFRRCCFFFFDLSDLVDASLVASAVKTGTEPGADDLVILFRRCISRGQGQDVRVIVFTRETRNFLVPGNSCSYPGNFV